MSRGRSALPLVGLLALAACSGRPAADANAGRTDEAVPVEVATAHRQDVPVQVRGIGTVEASATVAVKSRVDGQVARVLFQEGQNLKQGDLLFEIDSRPFLAALRQAEANLAREEVQARNAHMEQARLEALYREGVISKDEHDRASTQAASAAAAAKAAAAALERARLELDYCSIRSPIDGRIGEILVHAGNVVKENDTTLAVVNRLRPVYVGFSVPQQELLEIRRYMAAGPLPVLAFAGDDAAGAVGGNLDFINNTVDTNTGTVLLKGRFANDEEALWPGQFVNVALTLATRQAAVVIPARAVQVGQAGSYVFLVKPDHTVESRPVTVGVTAGSDVVIDSGLDGGETIVTEGQLRLAPGMSVTVREPNTA